MSDFLSTILETKRAEVETLRRSCPGPARRSQPRRPFAEALRRASPHLAVIAEIKKASPSKGLICPEFDPVSLARQYAGGGAAAISVLTDRRYFQGCPEYLIRVRAATDLPVLRKDFIIDPLQVDESAAMNADAMLLIVAALSDPQMAELYAAAVEHDVEPLVEVHSRGELERALKLSPVLVGINNRDLATFATDLRTTVELAAGIPAGVTVVSESGISTAEDASHVAGAHAILVGEALVRAADPAALIGELRHVDQNQNLRNHQG